MTESANTHGMTMRYPATRWQDALPVGSGVVGALMYGQIRDDTILLNHDSLYFPRGRPEVLDVSALLPEVRDLIKSGRYRDAAQVMPAAYAERAGVESGSTNKGRDPYQPFCSILLGTPDNGPFRDYRRGVDFASGRAWMRWTDDAATFTREVFVSRATDTVFLRIRGSEAGSVGCRVSLQAARNEQMSGPPHSNSVPADIELSASQRVSAGERSVAFVGRYANGFSFGAVGHLETSGGSVSAADDALVVEGADEAVMRVRLFLGEDPDEAAPRLLAELGDTPPDFDAAFAEHSRLHGGLFGGMTLDLDCEGRASNEEMLMSAYEGDVPTALVRTMFEYGRYLLICSSRPGGWPANLQGIWNGDYAPAWNSDIHTDENIQMNYWQALPGGLAEAALPMFDYFERFIDDFRENARNIFGCRGILIPIAMTTTGHDTPRSWSNWTAAAGWIAQHFYDYYLFTGDREFLRNRAVPFLKETALFYEDFLVKGDDGKLLFNPSLSPENRPRNSNSLIAMNATMDVAICREVLTNLCDACEILGIETDGVRRWRDMLEGLPEYEINEDGAMKEWLHPAFEDNYHHRHQSHIYPLFPGLEITEETSPELYKACREAVEKRLVVGLTSQTGWSMAHMANIYARLGWGDRSLECLELLTRSSTGPNLFTYHNDWRCMGLSLGHGGNPPFQIDANLGIASAVLEMLAFSKPGMIKLLPALPTRWRSGAAKGIACRGGVTVDMEWNAANRQFAATLTSREDQELVLRLPKTCGEVSFTPHASAAPDTQRGPGYWKVSLKEGVPVKIASDAGN